MTISQAGGGGGPVGFGVAFLVSAEVVAAFVAKACSSPQTTELNPHRGPTLMKWVNIGSAEAVLFVAAAAYFDRAHRVPILAGAGLELAITYAEYLHARQASTGSTEPGTEPGSGGGSAPRRWGWA